MPAPERQYRILYSGRVRDQQYRISLGYERISTATKEYKRKQKDIADKKNQPTYSIE